MAGDQDGMLGKIADTFNEIAAANQRIAQWIIMRSAASRIMIHHIFQRGQRTIMHVRSRHRNIPKRLSFELAYIFWIFGELEYTHVRAGNVIKPVVMKLQLFYLVAL